MGRYFECEMLTEDRDTRRVVTEGVKLGRVASKMGGDARVATSLRCEKGQRDKGTSDKSPLRRDRIPRSLELQVASLTR